MRERIETPDGDFFDVDTKYCRDNDTASMVIMLHGLESNSDSSLSHQIASACLEQGMSFTCVNFRSCSEDEDGNIIGNPCKGYDFQVDCEGLLYCQWCSAQGNCKKNDDVCEDPSDEVKVQADYENAAVSLRNEGLGEADPNEDAGPRRSDGSNIGTFHEGRFVSHGSFVQYNDSQLDSIALHIHKNFMQTYSVKAGLKEFGARGRRRK